MSMAAAPMLGQKSFVRCPARRAARGIDAGIANATQWSEGIQSEISSWIASPRSLFAMTAVAKRKYQSNSAPDGFNGDTDDASNDDGTYCRSSRRRNRSAVPRTARRKRRRPRLQRPHRRAQRRQVLNPLPPRRRPCRRVRPTPSLRLGRSWRLQAQTGACSPQRHSDVGASCNKHKNAASDDDRGQKQKAQIGFPRRL